MLMELCPCCGVRLLRHASKSGSYLRCGSCRFEIPEELSSTPEEDTSSDNGVLEKLDIVDTPATTP